MANTVKQVIVMRREYVVNGNKIGMGRGKEIAQGSHASMAFICKRLQQSWWKLIFMVLFFRLITKVELKWMLGSFAKVVLQVQTENELLEIYNKAKTAGLEVHLITDSGKTEFHGVQTNTCLAIGPDYSDNIDPITGNLKRY